VGVVLFRPENPVIPSATTGGEARRIFEELFPQFVPMIAERDFEVMRMMVTMMLLLLLLMMMMVVVVLVVAVAMTLVMLMM
jgi:hypothetical protein